jgi:hypothetical protein
MPIDSWKLCSNGRWYCKHNDGKFSRIIYAGGRYWLSELDDYNTLGKDFETLNDAKSSTTANNSKKIDKISNVN